MNHLAITRSVDKSLLRWPTDEERDSEDPYFLGNQYFLDLSDLTLNDALEALASDQLLVEMLRNGGLAEEPIGQDDSEFGDEAFGCLDVGVRGAVAAIAASGGFPVASCNGGSFGTAHAYQHPLVAFYCQPHCVDQIMAAAEMASVGLIHGTTDEGSLLLYSSDVDGLMDFASKLIAALHSNSAR
ncbi:MAG: hypothetical protein J0M36_03970 [Caulobacterales bacterium]|nr:hypothetical protein [Caulobacterales bacterium]